MSKTTSFSKILASKNNIQNDSAMSDNLINHTTINKKITHRPQPPPPPMADSFFIDSINENNNILINKQPEYLDQTTVRMKNWKSESNLSGKSKRRTGQMDAFNKSCNDNVDDYESDQVEGEEFDEDDENFEYYVDGINGEETSLEDEVNNIGPLQFSDHAGLYDPHETQDENLMNQSEYLDEDKRRIIFDNFDVYTKKNYKLTYDRSQHQIHPHQQIASNKNQSAVNQKHKMINNNDYVRRNNQNTDSLLSSTIMQQSSNLDGSNYLDEDDEEDDDEDEYEDQEEETDEYSEENAARLFINHNNLNLNSNQNPGRPNEALFKNDYYAYLNALKKQHHTNSKNSEFLSSMNSSNQQISDSIMNWSMKISNYNQPTNQYIDFLNNNLRKNRSKSRSPPTNQNTGAFPRSNSSFSKFYNQENGLEDSVTVSPPVQFRNPHNNLKPNNKSTTSWGKLKHSKSSSSNIGCSIDDQSDLTAIKSTTTPAIQEQEKPAQSQPHKTHSTKAYRKQRNHTTNNATYFHDDRPQSINDPTIQSFLNQHNINTFEQFQDQFRRLSQMPATVSTPSLFNLFQKSRATTSTNNINHHLAPHNINNLSDEFSSETTNSSNSNRNQTNPPKHKVKQKKHDNAQKRQQHNHRNSTNTTNSRTTSFSQLRQRSLSSCGIGTDNIQNSSTSSSINQSASSSSTSNTNSISKKPVGIQFPAPIIRQTSSGGHTETIVCMLVDRNNIKTNEDLMAVAARAARAYKQGQKNMFNTKASLPDLTFLKDYADEKPLVEKENRVVKDKKPNEQVPAIKVKTSASAAVISQKNKTLTAKQPLSPPLPTVGQPNAVNHQQSSATVSGSDLLKRKTLKSIKRYRQTKQNTEPCNQNNQQLPIEEMDTNQLYNQYYLNNEQILNEYSNYRQKPQISPTSLNNCNNITLSTTSSSSGSGATNTSEYGSLLQRQVSLNSANSQCKQPLKSCLKRKDSQSSSQSQASSKASTNSPMVNKRSRSTTKSVITTNCPADIFNQSKCTLMFVPLVGYLFTYDKESAQRYSYYNKLERCRRVRIYRELTCEYMEEDDDEEDEEDEGYKNGNIQNQQGVSASKSDNDLRVKKSVTFLAHVIEHRQVNLRTPQSSGESTSTSSAAITPTATSPYRKVPDVNNEEQKKVISEAPLLQYNALIAMLKSNSNQNRGKEDPRCHPVNSQFKDLSQSPVKKPNVSAAVVEKLEKSKKAVVNRTDSKEFVGYFKTKSSGSQVIDADSISLASLSESPPSEFKFSDEEEEGNDSDAENQAAIRAAASFNNYNNNNSVKGLRKNADFPNKVKQPVSSINNIINPGGQTNTSNQIMELSKNIQQQQIKLNQLELLRNRKKNFHSILLKDAKLNNLKEILFEIKQHQQKLSILAQQKRELQQSPTNKVNSLIISSIDIKALEINNLSVSTEFRDTIEKLSQYIFDFLKQGLRSLPFDNIHMTNSNVLSPPNSPARERVITNPDSTSLTLVYSQYTQIWNLIESTISMNITSQSPVKGQTNTPVGQTSFYLPKEVYVNMFQEINNYANNTNQTYLIDSGINTSQLRRKHHFMVMLKSLKFKFQLFIVNLLNNKQMANWFEYLNREKSILKKHYDLKLPTANSGDSGVGELLSTSGSSSFSSSISSSQNIQNNSSKFLNSSNLLASLSVTSLANVSIFENEEYFNYYHKLLQQFSFIDFNLTSFNINHEKYVISSNCGTIQLTPPPSKLSERNHDKKAKPAVPVRKPSLSQTGTNFNTIPNSFSSPLPTHLSTTNGNNNGNGVLKSISKRFNIKSWFSSNSNNNNSVNSPNSKRKEILASQSTVSQVSTNSGNHRNFGQTTPPSQSNKLSLYETPPTKCCQNISQLAKQNQAKMNKNERPKNFNFSNKSLMKHSLSEPSLNALIN